MYYTLLVDRDNNYVVSLHKGGGVDYNWTSSSAVMTLTFNSTNLFTPQCFNITIIDDGLIELEEMFTVSLSLQMLSDPMGRVVLLTSSAPVNITDNDGKLGE